MNNPQKIISWLKYFDIEYIDEPLCEDLSSLDINNPSDQIVAIRMAMKPEIEKLNNVSLSALMKILEEVESYPESEVRLILRRVGMPFKSPLQDYVAFFRQVRNSLFS